MQENDSLYFAVEKCVDGCSPRSFSLGIRSQNVKFVKWSVAIYSNDPQLYRAHLVHQFQRSCEEIVLVHLLSRRNVYKTWDKGPARASKPQI